MACWTHGMNENCDINEPSTRTKYTYDPLYELTQVTQSASTTESYSYDAVGNRLSSSGVASYSYNASNELTANSLGSYSYDANGNTLNDASAKSYTWDFENRMVQTVVPGTGTVTFKYDPFGRRIQKSSWLGTTNYLYDGLGIIRGSFMTQPDSETIREIQSAVKGAKQVPASQVRGWLRHPSLEVLGAVTQQIVRQSRRVDPPLSMEEICGTVQEYYRQCLI